MSALNLCLFVSLAIAAVAQYYGDIYEDDYPLSQLSSGNQMQYVYRDAGTIYSKSGDSASSSGYRGRSYAYAAAGGSNGARAVAEAPGSFRKPYPTAAPTAAPTSAPTPAPTPAPTAAPTAAPTTAPTPAPNAAPTTAPTPAPTAAPTTAPTPAPTAAPTAAPTPAPTAAPTAPTAGTTLATLAPPDGRLRITLNVAGLQLVNLSIDTNCLIGRVVELVVSQAGGNLIQIKGCIRL